MAKNRVKHILLRFYSFMLPNEWTFYLFKIVRLYDKYQNTIENVSLITSANGNFMYHVDL